MPAELQPASRRIDANKPAKAPGPELTDRSNWSDADKARIVELLLWIAKLDGVGVDHLAVTGFRGPPNQRLYVLADDFRRTKLQE